MTRKLGGLPLAGSLLLGMAAIGVTPAQAEDTLKVCYMSHPVIEANVAMMEKWAKASGVELEKNPMSYSVYLPKMSQMLSSGGADCDTDDDNDSICDIDSNAPGCSSGPDNCPTIPNTDQADADLDRKSVV